MIVKLERPGSKGLLWLLTSPVAVEWIRPPRRLRKLMPERVAYFEADHDETGWDFREKLTPIGDPDEPLGFRHRAANDAQLIPICFQASP
jgi:hypothetical protein